MIYSKIIVVKFVNFASDVVDDVVKELVKSIVVVKLHVPLPPGMGTEYFICFDEYS